MKIQAGREGRQDKVRLVARFGSAHLVRRLNGIFELRGGTSEEQVEACEWISLFMHEAVLQTPPSQSAQPRPQKRLSFL